MMHAWAVLGVRLLAIYAGILALSEVGRSAAPIGLAVRYYQAMGAAFALPNILEGLLLAVGPVLLALAGVLLWRRAEAVAQLMVPLQAPEPSVPLEESGLRSLLFLLAGMVVLIGVLRDAGMLLQGVTYIISSHGRAVPSVDAPQRLINLATWLLRLFIAFALLWAGRARQTSMPRE